MKMNETFPAPRRPKKDKKGSREAILKQKRRNNIFLRAYMIFEIICTNKTLTQIAYKFGVSVNTVSKARKRILRQIGENFSEKIIYSKEGNLKVWK